MAPYATVTAACVCFPVLSVAAAAIGAAALSFAARNIIITIPLSTKELCLVGKYLSSSRPALRLLKSKAVCALRCM